VRRWRGKLILLGLLVGLTLSGYSYSASSYKFTPIVVKGADFTVPTAINDSDQVVGYFIGSIEEGFVFSRNRFFYNNASKGNGLPLLMG